MAILSLLQTRFCYNLIIAGLDRPGNYAEIEFYGKKNKQATEELLSGKIIGVPAIQADDPNPYTHAMDGRLETHYGKPREVEGWVGLDLGKGNEHIITEERIFTYEDGKQVWW